jgi:hypothetical protein
MALDELKTEKVSLLKHKEVKIKKLIKEKNDALAPIRASLQSTSDGYDTQINDLQSQIATLEEDLAALD